MFVLINFFMMKQVLLLALAVFVLALTACNESPKPASTTEAETTAEPAKQASAVYACPMKCEGEKTYNKPGTCPVCKMELAAVTESEEEEHDHPHDEESSDD